MKQNKPKKIINAAGTAVPPDAREDAETKSFWRRPVFWLPLIFTLSAYVFLKICQQNAQAGEAARYVFPYITYLPRYLNTFIPFSLTEAIVVIGGILLLAGIIASVVRLIRKDGRKAFLLKWAKGLYLVFCLGFCLFHLNFGFCYHRAPLHENLGLPAKARSADDLLNAGLWLADEVNALTDKVSRTEEGLFAPALSLDEVMYLSADAYKTRAEAGDNEFVREHLYRGPVRTKPVILSHYWSYTGITGVYVPFITESSVNIAPPADDIIFTAMHEVAHSYGFAREDEANFLAFYNGILHENEEVRYACWLSGFSYVNNALGRNDREKQGRLLEAIRPEAYEDILAGRRFWRQYEGPVETISTQVNHAYLKANKVEDGVKSYGRVVDLILAYYDEYHGALRS